MSHGAAPLHRSIHAQAPLTPFSASPLHPHSHDPSSRTSLQALALIRRNLRGLDHGEESSKAALSSSSDRGNGNSVEGGGEGSASAPLALATDDLEASSTAGGAAYLSEARLPPSAALDVQLEVRQRSKEPPTPSQLQTILGYLKASPAGDDTTAAPSSSSSSRFRQSAESIAAQGPVASKVDDHHPAAMGISGAPPSAGLVRARTGARPAAAAAHKLKAPSSLPSSATSPPPPPPPAPQPQWAAALDDGPLVTALQNSQLLVVDWEGGRATTDLPGLQRLLDDLRREQDEQVSREQGKGSGPTSCLVM